MAEEIELEALPQHRLVDLADPALPGGAGVRHHDVDPAEGARHRANASRTEAASVTSQPSPSAAPPIALASACAAASSRSSTATSAPSAAKACAVAAPIAPARAGDDHDLARQRRFPGAAQLGLLQRPVFHVEQIGLGQRLEAADRLGVA